MEILIENSTKLEYNAQRQHENGNRCHLRAGELGGVGSLACWLVVCCVLCVCDHRVGKPGLYFSNEEPESESAACTGTAAHDPGLVDRFFAITSILPSFSRFMVESSSGYSD